MYGVRTVDDGRVSPCRYCFGPGQVIHEICINEKCFHGKHGNDNEVIKSFSTETLSGNRVFVTEKNED